MFLAVAAATLGSAFYFRGREGDYNLYYITQPHAQGNEYVPSDASGSLRFPRLLPFAVGWSVVGLGGWLAVAWALARREGMRVAEALPRAAVALYPLIALLAVPAHHWVGLPLTIGPVFLMILCGALCVAVAAHLLRPSAEGRLARAVCSTGGVWALCAVYIAVFTTLCLKEYHALHMGFPDTGVVAEALFHGSQGEALRSNASPTGTLFTPHAHCIVAPLAWLYRLWPRHELLMVLHTAWLGIGAVPVYLLARRVLGDRFAAWCVAVAYLVAPTTAFVNLPSTYGFSPMVMLPTALLWAMCFLERRNLLWGFFFLFLALYIKETAAPVVVMLGVFLAWRHRRWGAAAGAIALGIGWFVLATRVIQPYALDSSPQFTPFLARFGSSAPEVVVNVVRHPLDTLAYMFGKPLKVWFLLHLLVPLLLLPLLSPSAAGTWAASFAILVLARYHAKHTLLIGSQAPALAGLYLAAVYGLKNLSERRGIVLRRLVPARWLGDGKGVMRAAAAGLVVAAVLSGYFFFVRTMPWGRFRVAPRTRIVSELRERIPRDVSLCASYRLASHFTDQADLYLAPTNLAGARFVALDLYDEWAGLPTMAGYRATLLRSPLYAPVFARDGFLIFEREGRSDLFKGYLVEAVPEGVWPEGGTFDGFATLLGIGEASAPGGIELTLYWRCEKPTDRDLAVVLHFTCVDWRSARSWRYLPADGVLPTWMWKPGQIIADRIVVPGLTGHDDVCIPDLGIELVEVR
ncbi:MAG: DUF2079 domain-containing protein [Candidatus Brocadiae bacterium]|nr:DUF2079 domain-containing protein [Candidatus Brocadiia bacterium]